MAQKPGRRNVANQLRMRRQIAATKPACHICGDSIDYTLKHPDPKSFVIDHIIPLTRGGADALTNVKAAHRLETATPRRGHASSRPSSDGAGRSGKPKRHARHAPPQRPSRPGRQQVTPRSRSTLTTSLEAPRG